MTTALFNIIPILPLLESGATVLTPNKRLCSHIHRAYSIHQASNQVGQKSSVVLAPKVFSLTEWLQQQWQLLQYNGLTTNAVWMSDVQRQWCWQQVITEHHSECLSPLIGLSLQKMARLADEAHRNLILWKVDNPDLLDANYTAIETKQLLQWIDAFNQKLQQQNCLIQEQIIARLERAAIDQQLQPLAHIHLQSFDDLPPLIESLLTKSCSTLSHSQDLHQAEIDTPEHNSHSTVYRTQAANRDTEILAAAHWSWKILQEDPSANIGIIVPDLGTQRQAIEQGFLEVFESHTLLPGTERYPLPFNISAGTPLGQTPLINDTLSLLKLSLKNISLEDAYQLVYSPFFSDLQKEIELRSAIVSRLRKLQKNQLRTSAIRSSAQQEYENGTNIEKTPPTESLCTTLQSFETFNRQHQHQRNNAQTWVTIFQKLLEILGWPGKRPLDSVEYQQILHWQRLLETFTSLDAMEPSDSSQPPSSNKQNMSLTQALGQLEELSNNTHFQTQVKASPIHILGTLEAAGLHFSHSWLLGFDNQRWPPKPNPNPLLPTQLQRSKEMPRGSHERELRYARSLTQGFLSCAENIVVSYALQEGEDLFEPSPLITDLPIKPLNEFYDESHSSLLGLQQYRQQLLTSKTLELVDNEFGPKIDTKGTNNQERVKGGTSVLQQQASCPFNAFARKRLGATQIKTPLLGLGPIERGNLLHAAMAFIWLELKGQLELLSLDEGSLNQLIKNAVETAFIDELKFNDNELGPHYLELEQQRLEAVIHSWLQQEKQRPPFQILAVEEDYEASFDGMLYKFRIDRVDQLPSGKLLLIDYKTGSTSISSWLEERPGQPQLPLYSLTFKQDSSDAICGIAFAEINAKTQRLLGAADLPETEDIKGIITTEKALEALRKKGLLEREATNVSFSVLQEIFNQKLTALSQEFQTGYAAVEYKSISDTQRIDQDLLPLNRYWESEFIESYLHDKSPRTSQEP